MKAVNEKLNRLKEQSKTIQEIRENLENTKDEVAGYASEIESMAGYLMAEADGLENFIWDLHRFEDEINGDIEQMEN
jgi:hypothetical protein